MRIYGIIRRFTQAIARYAQSHPEYFSLVDGVRRTDSATQLCLTNPDVKRLCIEAVRKCLRERPEAHIISISQNDYAFI